MRWRQRGRRGSGGGKDGLNATLSQTWEAAAAAVGKMLDLAAGEEALLASSGLVREETTDQDPQAGVTRLVARRRRRWRLALSAAATVGAAALTAAAVALPVTGVPPREPHKDTDLTANVVKHVDSALSAAEPGEIVQMTITASGAVTAGGMTGTTTAQEWSYGGQWRSVINSPTGHPVYDEGSSTASVYTLVSYLTRTWARQQEPHVPVVPASAPAFGPRGCAPVVAALSSLFIPGLPGIGSAASSPPVIVARSLRAAISCGTLASAGRQRVNGIEAIELTSRPDSTISETIWVSPSTYLPVRVVVRSAPGKVLLLTADTTWLQPTVRNLARLAVPVPAGFRRVPMAEATAPAVHERVHQPPP